jgi:hypothetical protein
MRFQKMRRRRAFVLDHGDQCGNCDISSIWNVNGNGRKRRVGNSGDLNIVMADNGEIARYGQAQMTGRLERPAGQDISPGQQSRWRRGQGMKLKGRPEAIFLGRSGFHDQFGVPT